MYRKALVTAAATPMLLVGLSLGAAPAHAASVNVVPPGWFVAQGGAGSQGVGFCLSQVAQHPEYDGVDHFGQAVSGINAEDPGSVVGHLSHARYPECGGPGSGP
jgi:hypothetical protein